MVALKETEATERADWERKCRQKMDEEWKQQEESIREKFRKERDTELDRVVHKLEAEVISGRKELEVEFHERMRLVSKIFSPLLHNTIITSANPNCIARPLKLLSKNKCILFFSSFYLAECEANSRRKLPS